jgi:hypothetical protein
MPPHKRKNSTIEILKPWQLVWEFFIDHNIPLFPNSDSLPHGYDGEFLVLGPQTMIETDISSVAQLIDLVQSFWSTLTIELGDESAQFEWNYLGLSSERELYISYLTSVFWKNQTIFEHLGEYNELVAHPWKCLNYIPQLHEPVECSLATDNFSQKSLDFVHMVSQNIHRSEYNPYIIHSNQGSFQWSITIPDTFIIEGVLLSTEEGLKNRVDIIPLTEIVI